MRVAAELAPCPGERGQGFSPAVAQPYPSAMETIRAEIDCEIDRVVASAAMHRHLGDRRSKTFPYVTRYAKTPHGPVAYFDEGTGPAIIFVHGLAGDFTHFEHTAPAFAKDHRVIGVDMPGCGISCKPDTKHSIRGYAATILDLMDQLGIARATLVGHSAGGQIVAEAAAMAPSRIDRLVMINAAGLRSYAPPLRWLARALFRPALLQRVLEPAARPILTQVFHGKNHYTEKFIVDSIERPQHPLLGEIAKVFHDLTPDLLSPSIVANARMLTMPSMLIWGSEDRLVPLAGVRRAAAALPDCRLEVISQCGHMPIIERPELTVALIRSFLSVPEVARAAA